VLGRGAFKVVYKAFDTQEGTEMAWNQVRVSEVMSAKDAENKEERDRLFAEIRVLKALKHKNIMSFYDSWYDPKTYTVNFITELFTSGTLRQYRKRHKHIDEEVVKRWAYQILCGLVYLHGHNPPIIHRDLKCDNIFINGSDGVVKIGDLGLATMLRSRTAPQSVLGTPEFMAPELYEEEYDDRVDVYSFGMCLLELSTMEYPYAECKNAAQIYRKVSLGVRPAGLQKVASGELTEFINVCISPRESRPRARQLLKHPYFDSIRRDKALASSRSEAALAAAAGGGGGGGGGADAGSDYGSATSGPVSRTASSLAEMMAAVGSASGISRGPSDVAAAAQLPPGVVLPPGSVPPVPGPPSASSSSGHPLSRTVSAEAHSERAGSDSASVRSQRSNASELAMAVLENIAEEAEGTGVDVVLSCRCVCTSGSLLCCA
jgi:WNK lysine deficient protein kinase